MPLKSGKGHAIVAANIKELIRSGREPKQAVAIALSHSRKMAKGGMVEDDDEYRSLGELMEQGDQPDVANPEEQVEESDLMQALKRSDEVEAYAMGGLVQGGPDADEPVGNKPEEEMSDGLEDKLEMPVKPAEEDHAIPVLSDLAMKEIEERKKRRRFM